MFILIQKYCYKLVADWKQLLHFAKIYGKIRKNYKEAAMDKIMPLLLSAITLMTSCSYKNPAERQDGSEISQPSAASGDQLKFWFPDKRADSSPAIAESIRSLAAEEFTGVLENGAENIKIKLLFGEDDCSVISGGGCPQSTVKGFVDKCGLSSCYLEICLDSRFTYGVGVSMIHTENAQNVPEVMPDAFNFADGVFDGDLSEIRTYPELKNGTSLAAYEYSDMTGCISELNGIAKAGAQAALDALNGRTGFYDESYINSYGTAHAVFSSDKSGKWSVNARYNDPILTNEYTNRVISSFNKSKTLSEAKNCTIQLMFYMENFVGVSADWSADEKYFATYSADVDETWKAPCEESYYRKTFLNWSSESGCLKGENGRLCPVGTYCLATEEPLWIYVDPSIFGDWKPATVGGRDFAEYEKDISDGWTDYSGIKFSISGSRMLIYNYGSTDVYDIVKTADGYDVEYHGAKHGSISVENGKITLYLWHHSFTQNNKYLPIVLERAENPVYDWDNDEPYEPYDPPAIPTADEFAAQDTEKLGLLDLTGKRVVGQQIDDPNVLSAWRKYAADGGAYTMETYQTGASRLEYSLYSTDGKNGYHRWDLVKHDDNSEPDYGWEYIYYDGYVYDCGYQQSRYDLRKFDCHVNTDGDALYCPLFSVSEWYPLHFVKAYTVSIGGVEYVAEEWQMGDLDNGYIVYSINGELKGFEGSFYGKKVTTTIKKLEKQGDSTLIRKPDRLTGKVFSEFE